MIKIEKSRIDKDILLVNGKTLIIPFYRYYKKCFSCAEQESIDSYLKGLEKCDQ